MDYDLVLAANFVAIVIGVISSIAAFMASRRYYGGPWRSTVLWITWGTSLFTIRAMLVFADSFFDPAVENIAAWIKYPPVILGFLCMMNAALVMNQMADYYSGGSRVKFGEDVKKPGKR